MSFNLINNPHRTKWKRQNQLRLEQLRHHASVEKELLHAATSQSEVSSTQQTGNGSAAPGHQSSIPCCTSSPFPHSCCNFLTSAAAVALFRNVGYVHGPM